MQLMTNQTSASGLRFAVEDEIARVEIDLPGAKVNKLTSAWMAEFEALLDRLAHHATVITTKGKSYRMRKRRGGGS